MSPITLLAIASTLALYICVALCAMWACSTRQWWLAAPLVIIFAVSTLSLVWIFERWGT